MKNVIKKILKEELDSNDLNWVREVDPIEHFGEWVYERSSHYGFNDENDETWLDLIENTKLFISELTEETHTLLGFVESMKNQNEIKKSKTVLNEISSMIGDGDGYLVELFHEQQNSLREFLDNFGNYGEKHNLSLDHLLDLTHTFFDDRVDSKLLNKDK